MFIYLLQIERYTDLRGNHLSNATCLMQVFFESGESCGKFN